MPYYPYAGGGELNLEYPLQDSKLGCTPYEYNISYVIPEIPDDAGHIILTQVVQYDFLVITTYCRPDIYNYPLCPRSFYHKFIRFCIYHDEKNHCLAMHKRSKPFSTFHVHYGLNTKSVTELRHLTPFLYYLFMPIESFRSTDVDNSRYKCVDQFIYSVGYLIGHSEEPGINFENGHYALRDGYNTDSVYFHSPYKLVTAPESAVSINSGNAAGSRKRKLSKSSDTLSPPQKKSQK